MWTFDPAVLQLLEKCGCSIKFISKFAGLTVEKLNKYTLEDFVGLLGSDACDDNARKVYEEVQRSKKGNEEKKSVDEDVEILDVIVKDNAQRVITEDEIINVEEEAQTGLTSPVEGEVNNFPNGSSDGPQSSGVNNLTQAKEEEDSSVDEFPVVLDPMENDEGFLNLLTNNRCHVQILGQKNSHNCSMGHPPQQILQQWNGGLSELGYKINSLEMSTWTWQESCSPCPYNLLKILTKCPSLRKLSLKSAFSDIPHYQSAWLPAEFKLSKLQVLEISHEGDVVHSVQYLKQIIVTAVNLKKIYYTFENLTAATSFLLMLESFRGYELRNLQILSIKSKAMDSYLTQEQLLQLVAIMAPSLEELELGNGLWEDVQGRTIQQILSNFSTLKKFVVRGTFKGSREILPNVVIVCPPMANLEYIRLGADYGYLEGTTTTRASTNSSRQPGGPPAKIRKSSIGDRINSTTSSSVRPFTITLQFPNLLPRLKGMYLGNMFQLDQFRFSYFPQLEAFYCGSRWDLAVIFPPLNSRHASYPHITRLKIPDSLSDPSFLNLIPARFPNLLKCKLVLPTVKIIRTFFSIMADSKLEEFVLMTQFDFPSSLDTCLLDKPTEVIQSKSELDMIRLLKQYIYWEEFFQHHNIQLPVEDLSSLEGEGLAGLSALKNLKNFLFNHQRRTLEIPKGTFHWDLSGCTYTGSFIGFRQYPWSARCEELRNNLVYNRPGFDDRYLRYDVQFRVPKKPDNLSRPDKWEPSPANGGNDIATTTTVPAVNSADMMDAQYELEMQRALHLSKRDNHVKANGIYQMPTASQQLQQQNAAAGLPTNPRSYCGPGSSVLNISSGYKRLIQTKGTIGTKVGTAGQSPAILNHKVGVTKTLTGIVNQGRTTEVIAKIFATPQGSKLVFQGNAQEMTPQVLVQIQAQISLMPGVGPGSVLKFLIQSPATPTQNSTPTGIVNQGRITEVIAKIFATPQGTKLVFQGNTEETTPQVLAQIQTQISSMAGVGPGSVLKFLIQSHTTTPTQNSTTPISSTSQAASSMVTPKTSGVVVGQQQLYKTPDGKIQAIQPQGGQHVLINQNTMGHVGGQEICPVGSQIVTTSDSSGNATPKQPLFTLPPGQELTPQLLPYIQTPPQVMQGLLLGPFQQQITADGKFVTTGQVLSTKPTVATTTSTPVKTPTVAKTVTERLSNEDELTNDNTLSSDAITASQSTPISAVSKKPDNVATIYKTQPNNPENVKSEK